MTKLVRHSMAIVLSTFIFCSLSTNAVESRKAPPALLSYQALMRLSPAKRAVYLNDIAKMLVKLEEVQENGEEDKYAEYKEQILNILQLIPQAQAESQAAAAPETAVPPHPAKKGKIYTDRIPEEKAPAPKAKGSTEPNKADTPSEGSKCEVEQPVSCKEYSAEEKKAARKEINDPSKFKKEERLCIIGGSFSTYRNGVAAPGKCRKAKVDKCKPNEGLCNPYLFCTQYADASKTNKLPTVCLPLKVGNKVDLTARCDAFFNGDLAAVKLKKCEEGTLPPGFQEKWNEMRNALSANYKNFCAREAFKILNCNECTVMSKYLGEAALKATGKSCADEPVAATANPNPNVSYPYVDPSSTVPPVNPPAAGER